MNKKIVPILGVAMILMCAKESVALQKIEDLSSTRQIYSSGYGARDYGEKFHATELYGPSGAPYEVDITGPTESAITTEETQTPAIWRIYREAGFATTYESNLFSSRIDPKDDVTYIYSGTIGVGRREKMYYVRLFYDIAYNDHIEYQKLSDYTHTARQEFGYTFNRFTINVRNSITPRQVVSVGERTDLGPAGSTISPITDSASVDINYKVSPKTTASFLYFYGLFYEPHIEGVSSSDQTHTFGPQIQYQVTPKNQVYGRLLWRTIDYFDDQETKSWTMTPSVGIKSRISPKMTLNLEAAFPSREYKNDLISVVDGVALRGALFRKITPKVSGSIYGAWDNSVEDLDTSRSENFTRTTRTYGANLSWAIAPRLRFDADANITLNNSESFITKVDPENDTLSFTRQPEDDIYEWSVGLSWNPRRYVSVFFGYQFENHNASFKNDEYDNHRGVGSIEARF